MRHDNSIYIRRSETRPGDGPARLQWAPRQRPQRVPCRRPWALPRALPQSLPLFLLVPLSFAGCGYFPQSSLQPNSDFAWLIQDLFTNIFWWAVVVFVLVEGALLYAIFRFREKEGGPEPKQTRGNTAVEIAWTLAPAIILCIIAIPTIRTIWLVDRPPRQEAMQIAVVGHQWWWEFRYPELGVVTANELHVPVGQTVDLHLTSEDVIHSFWAPRLGGKRDVVPGDETRLWFTADTAGTFPGQCAEFCGTSHALMGLRVMVDAPAEFEEWAARNAAPAQEPDTQLEREGETAFLSSACVGCHTIRGTPAAGVLGPDLTHVGSRNTIAAGVLENTPENMARWIAGPQDVKPGALMPDLPMSEEQIRAITAYLQGLE